MAKCPRANPCLQAEIPIRTQLFSPTSAGDTLKRQACRYDDKSRMINVPLILKLQANWQENALITSQLSCECIAAVMRMHRSCHANASQLSCECIAVVMHTNHSCHSITSQLPCTKLKGDSFRSTAIICLRTGGVLINARHSFPRGGTFLPANGRRPHQLKPLISSRRHFFSCDRAAMPRNRNRAHASRACALFAHI